MSESDDFLSRWSRRKHAVAREVEAEKSGPPSPAANTAEEAKAAPAKQAALPKGESRNTHEPEEVPFDLSKLPPLDSIMAGSDIRPFLAAGVPATLRQAALRRFWATDPHVKGIVELAENTWDFTGAAEIPGFDFAPPTGDIRKMVAELFGEKPNDEANSPDAVVSAEHESAADISDQIDARDEQQDTAQSEQPAAPNNAAHESEQQSEQRSDAATQYNDAMQKSELRLVSRRSHGSAMPK